MEWYIYLLGIFAISCIFLSILGIAAVRSGAIADSHLAKIHKRHIVEDHNRLPKRNANKTIFQRDSRELS
jgi:hypothetical protein